MLSKKNLLNPNTSGPRQMILPWPMDTVIVFQLILSPSHRTRNKVATEYRYCISFLVPHSVLHGLLLCVKDDSLKSEMGTSNWWRADHCLLFQLQESLGKWVSDMFEFHKRRWLLPDGIKDFINMTNVFRCWVFNN